MVVGEGVEEQLGISHYCLFVFNISIRSVHFAVYVDNIFKTIA